MMELTPDLIRKHKDRILEVTVKAHQSRSKKGKVFSVKQHERKLKDLSEPELHALIKANDPKTDAARAELRYRYKAESDRIKRDSKIRGVGKYGTSPSTNKAANWQTGKRK